LLFGSKLHVLKIKVQLSFKVIGQDNAAARCFNYNSRVY
jgi:hypothetical protein